MATTATNAQKGHIATVNGWRLTRDGLGRVYAKHDGRPYYRWQQFSGPDAEQQARAYAEQERAGK